MRQIGEAERMTQLPPRFLELGLEVVMLHDGDGDDAAGDAALVSLVCGRQRNLCLSTTRALRESTAIS